MVPAIGTGTLRRLDLTRLSSMTVSHLIVAFANKSDLHASTIATVHV